MEKKRKIHNNDVNKKYRNNEYAMYRIINYFCAFLDLDAFHSSRVCVLLGSNGQYQLPLYCECPFLAVLGVLQMPQL